MAKNINNEPFDEATKLKLDIFGDSFEKWLPVFINDRYTNQVVVFDFFAGSGKDKNGEKGSPLILLDKAKGLNKQYCGAARKSIQFIFNEFMSDKSTQLSHNVSQFITDCTKENGCKECIYELDILKQDFQEVFQSPQTQSILSNSKIAKFILLDQYGFKEINDDIFLKLVSYPRTDFIFFISSSFVRRFKEHPNTKKYISTEKIDFENAKAKDCHRIIANYFRSLIPQGREYYIHHFTIQKEKNKGNFYGLIFGSNHTLGMEKFLKTCWKYDKFSGEANFNIENDFKPGELFYDPNTTNKKTQVKDELKRHILSGRISDNITGFKFVMRKGCEPSLFTELIKELEKANLIKREGDKNNSSTNIHKAKQYFIKLVK